MFQHVDLTDPFMSAIFTTGIAAWIICILSGLWFVVAGACHTLWTFVESRRLVGELFPEIDPSWDMSPDHPERSSDSVEVTS